MVETEALYELKKQLKKLSEMKGNGTELVSVYIPAGYPIHETANKLREEINQAGNIKSKTTRNNVIDALERIIAQLKMYKQTPPNGMVVFAGNISKVQKTTIELFSLEPLQPLNISVYKCDSHFFLEPLQRMLETTDSYGLVVMDGREATIAILKGTQTIIVKKLNSMAHAKIRKGGQCLATGTLLVTNTGEIIDIQNFKTNSKIIGLNFQTSKTANMIVSDYFITHAKHSIILKTQCPMYEIQATPYHKFFVLTEYGIKEKFAMNLNEKDWILITKKINCRGKKIKTKFKSKMRIKLNENNKRKKLQEIKIKFPEYWNRELAKLVGIICGGGTHNGNRIIIYESNLKIAKNYYALIEKTFGIKPIICVVDKAKQYGSFAKKKYYEVRIYSQEFVRTINCIAPEIILKERDVPNDITKCDNRIVAAFLLGLYDARGYRYGNRVDIAMTNKKIMQKIQLLLLRFGILSSFTEKPVKGNKQWCVSISDKNSLLHFKNNIGFTRIDKQKKLETIFQQRINQQDMDQIPIDGREVFKLAQKIGLKTSDFHAASYFFRNKKPLRRKAFFRNILSVFKKHQNTKKEKQIFEYLNMVYISDVTIARIKEKKQITKKENFYDITTLVHSNFIANGFVVHNSARRFERIIEESIEYYYKRIGEAMDSGFLGKVKGVIIGGPGPAKDFFYKMAPYNYQHKILGVVDTGYTDEYGLREVLAKSESLINEQEAIKERVLVERLIKEITHDGLAIYGEKEVRHAIEAKQANIILLSEGLKEQLLIEELTELAKEKGIKVEIISENTAEGIQFLQGFGGICAFLKYK